MKRIRLTQLEKVNIIKKYDSMSLSNLAKEMKRPMMTVRNFYMRWLKRGYITNNKSFNKHKLRNLNIYDIELYLNRNPEATRKNIIKDFKLNVNPVTLSKFLKKNKIRFKNVPSKPRISDEHKIKRLEFVEKYGGWNDEDWKKVVFVDESSVEVSRTYRKKMWRKRGDQVFFRKNKTFCIKYFKVFSFITYEGQGELVFVENKWNSDNYIQILKESVIAKAEELVGKQFYLLQDSDTSHKSRKTMTFLKENGINLVDHPPNSPDLNPIENCWYMLKKELSKTFYFNELDQKVRAIQIWNSFSKSYCQKLILSMKKRVEEVKRKKGDITKY